MTFTEIALRMFPYWIMGLFMIYAVYNSSYRNLLRVEKAPILKWIRFLAWITVWRIVIFKLFAGNGYLHNAASGAMIIPWQATLTVFWEDACHGLPLAILLLALGNNTKWKRVLNGVALVTIMTAFGLGHVYQGYFAAFCLSFYIPFTMKKGQEIGFGTVMICHTIYDLLTILTLKTFLG